MTVLSITLSRRDHRWELWVSFEPPKPLKGPAGSSQSEPQPATVALFPKK